MHIHSLPGSLSWPKCIHFKSPVPISKDCLNSFPHQSFNWSDPFKPFHKNCKYVCTDCLPHACYLPHPIYPWFYQLWWREEATSVLIMTLYAPSQYFLCHRLKCPPNCPSLHMKDMLEEKDRYIKGTIYSKVDKSAKSSKRVPSFLVTPTTKTFLLLTLPFCVEVCQ